MAQTVSGLAQQAKDLLVSSFNADQRADKAQMISGILTQLAPTDPSSVLQLASLNPDELIDPVVMAAITKNIYTMIQNSLQEQLVSLQTEVDARQQELADQQAILDAQKSALDELGEAIGSIITP